MTIALEGLENINKDDKFDGVLVAKLHLAEKHIRKNKLRATFTDQLGRTGELDDVASLNEAHQLAFFLFWNIKPHFDR